MSYLELSQYVLSHVVLMSYLELSQYVLRHVVLSQRIHHEVLISGRPFTGPVLGTFLSSHLSQLGEHHHDGAVVLPQHPPEVLHRLVERTLGGNVGVPEEEIVRHFLQSD